MLETVARPYLYALPALASRWRKSEVADAKSHDDISNIRMNHDFFGDIPSPNIGQIFLKRPQFLLSKYLQFAFKPLAAEMSAISKKFNGWQKKSGAWPAPRNFFFNYLPSNLADARENARKVRALEVDAVGNDAALSRGGQ